MIRSTVVCDDVLVVSLHACELRSRRSSTSWPRSRMQVLPGGLRQNELAWVGNCDRVLNTLIASLAFRSRHIDEVDIGKSVEVVVVVGTARDSDGSAIHVELPVSDAVVPVPSESHDAVGHTLWQDVCERMGTGITVRVDGTPALEDLEDLESRVGGGFLVFGDCELTGSAAVGSRA